MSNIESGDDHNDHLENEMGQESFAEALRLADELVQTVRARNDFLQGFGGMDDFAAVHQHVGDNREVYDELERGVTKTRAAFAEGVPDKQEFVDQLQTMPDTEEMLTVISSMFSDDVRSSTSTGFLGRFRQWFD